MANYQNNPGGMPQAPKGMRLIFGIFMILVYLAVGILFFLNVFNIDNHGISIAVGAILCAYGVWRGIRLFIGTRGD